MPRVQSTAHALAIAPWGILCVLRGYIGDMTRAGLSVSSLRLRPLSRSLCPRH